MRYHLQRSETDASAVCYEIQRWNNVFRHTLLHCILLRRVKEFVHACRREAHLWQERRRCCKRDDKLSLGVAGRPALTPRLWRTPRLRQPNCILRQSEQNTEASYPSNTTHPSLQIQDGSCHSQSEKRAWLHLHRTPTPKQRYAYEQYLKI